jgi:HAD superfamily hydrolase (TIGR01493 family)
MPLDAEGVATVTFDSYSTIVDVDAAEQALAERVPDPESVSRLWRSRSLAYTFVANDLDAYQPFYEVNRDALTDALAAHGVDLDPAERDAILAVYHELDVFADVRAGMERPKKQIIDRRLAVSRETQVLFRYSFYVGNDGRGIDHSLATCCGGTSAAYGCGVAGSGRVDTRSFGGGVSGDDT